jgi:arsenate reductase-like glutaredoxin family protein
MKSNFKKTKNIDYEKYPEYKEVKKENRGLTKAEFEEFVEKSGAKGSFMIFRSAKKEDELGLEEL